MRVREEPDAGAVVVKGLSKSFRVPDEQSHTLKERALHPFRRTGQTSFTALRDATFDVAEGEFFGIVGRNGSGKSTLLKCLAGIYRADGGEAWIRGRLSTFIELGVGFNMDLPARDNIRLNAVMLGLSARDARRREQEIIAFAGLEEFQDLKIKNYSSGMLVRLGFSIMIHVDADVLLIDEVLAVGDAAFQQKCYAQFDRIRAEGRTVLFVTHDMNAVERYCDRAMLIEKGDVIGIGEPHEIGQEYLRVNFADSDQGAAGVDEQQGRWGDGRAEILRCWCEDAAGDEVPVLPHGEPMVVAASVRFREAVEEPIFGFELHNGRGELVVHVTSADHHFRTGSYAAGEEAVFRFRFDNVLAADAYTGTPSIAHRAHRQNWMDRRERLLAFTVTSSLRINAAVEVPADIAVERWPAADRTAV